MCSSPKPEVKCSVHGKCRVFCTKFLCSSPAGMSGLSPYVVYNFDKIDEPEIWKDTGNGKASAQQFEYEGSTYKIAYPKWLTALSAKTDRFTDALIYAMSILPAKKRKRLRPCWTRASATEFPACTRRRRQCIFFMGRCSAQSAARPISAERFPEERRTALRFIIRCGTAGSVRRGRLETAAGMRRLRKRNCCAEYPMRSAGNGRERKNLARSDFCGKCRPFILKMERRAFKSGRSACLRKCISGETEPLSADFLSKDSKGEMESAAFFVISAGET